MTTTILWCVGGVLGACVLGAAAMGFECHRRFGAQLEKSPGQNKQSQWPPAWAPKRGSLKTRVQTH